MNFQTRSSGTWNIAAGKATGV
ncbi:hypothetical protein [Enterocloster hominis (ex Hitch et al. 2024)]